MRTVEILAALIGVCVGAVVVVVVALLRRRSAQDVARQLIEQAQVQRVEGQSGGCVTFQAPVCWPQRGPGP